MISFFNFGGERVWSRISAIESSIYFCLLKFAGIEEISHVEWWFQKEVGNGCIGDHG